MTSAKAKAPFAPDEFAPGAAPLLSDVSGDCWAPMCRHACSFGPQDFMDSMMNLVKNPNINSSWLFRADIIYDDGPEVDGFQDPRPVAPDFHGLICRRTLVRKLIPRNTKRDDPLDQTCCIYQSETDAGVLQSLVVYIPHVVNAEDFPFYHPRVRGIAHLHEWDPSAGAGSISVHFLPLIGQGAHDDKLPRVAIRLLQVLNKHGHGSVAGYVKRVSHDLVVPQQRFQDRYSGLKNKYGADLVKNWAETTDPSKHVFEDLGIAAFLIELWRDMYQDAVFPGFVDIGCGNGLLVYILTKEGFPGWGFDARARKSWAQYTSPSPMSPSGSSLEKKLLLPSVVPSGKGNDGGEDELVSEADVHNGIFPKGTFIISNHADELTPWTPILATLSDCPFIMIPCCSHNLAGAKHRFPPPRDKTKGQSAFASLVDWVTRIAEDCGWDVETEMLRIPSTRNTGLLGRKRTKPSIDITAVLGKFGGAEGYYETVAKLLKADPKGH